ncbi:MAG: hypothetical protein NC833_00655 [Candidatus Omnitrophica bacterium]|nr:hypothetical protein [Candidatus Omnitrophota bacterium]
MNQNFKEAEVLLLFFLFISFIKSEVVVKIDGCGTFVSRNKPDKVMSKEEEYYRDILIVDKDNFVSYIKPNYEQIKEVIIEENDIDELILKFYVVWIKEPTTLYFYEILQGWDENVTWKDNIKFKDEPLIKYRIEKTGWHQVDITKIIKNNGFALKSDSQIRIVNFNSKGEFSNQKCYFELKIKEYSKYNLWEFDVKPQEDIYVEVKNGHLYYGNKRLRLWGVCRHDSRRLETVNRIKNMGFNAIRLWGPQNSYDTESIKKGEFTKLKFENEPVDLDSFDRFFYELKKNGIFVWCVSLHYMRLNQNLWEALLSDDSFLSSGDDWYEWKNAIREIIEKNNIGLYMYFLYFDERIQKLFMKNAENFLQHKNPYTNKKYAEEEAICVFEIQNENGFLKWVLERGFDSWPEYFRKKLQKKWNEFLIKKYRDTRGLIDAWGKLDEGEDIKKENIKLSPVFYERYKYPKQRGSDFIEFLSGMINEFNKKFESHCRKFAPKGKGVNVIPFVYDTLFRLNNAWLYVNSQGNINSMGIYIWKLTSSLTVSPSLYVVDSTTIDGKPNLIYEVNVSRPDPYRSEFPFKISSFASYQDWDGLFWHYWNELESPGRNYIPDEQYLISPLPYMTETWADGGIVHASDPVMCSSLSLSGHIFRRFLISPAEKPTIYKIGRNGIFNYDYFRGISTTKESFETGARIKFDLNQEEPVKIEQGEKKRQDIIYEFEKGRMIIDNEKIKGYIGYWSKDDVYMFKEKYAIFNVSTPFISFVMCSKDGENLSQANEIYLTSLFDAKNKDFEIDMSIAREGGGFVGPWEQGKAIKNRGKPPVIMDKVNLDIYFPFSIYGRIEFYDFALRKFYEKRINGDNVINLNPPKNYYIIKLHIEKKGNPKQKLPEIKKDKEKLKPEHTEKILFETNKYETLWFPIEGLTWSKNYAYVHQFLRDSSLNFTSISPFDSSDKKEKSILLSEFKIFDCITDMEIFFKNEFMNRVSFTFKEVPSLEFILDKLKRFVGEPVEHKKAKHAFEKSLVIWRLKSLKIELTEFQGFVSLIFILEE